MLVLLAAEPPPASAHVREQQDDENNRQDDVHHHWPPVLNETKPSCEVSPDLIAMSPPSGGFETHKVGVRLARKGVLDRLGDDVARCRLLGADAMAEDEGGEPRDVLGLDLLPPLRGRAGFCPGEEMA